MNRRRELLMMKGKGGTIWRGFYRDMTLEALRHLIFLETQGTAIKTWRCLEMNALNYRRTLKRTGTNILLIMWQCRQKYDKRRDWKWILRV